MLPEPDRGHRRAAEGDRSERGRCAALLALGNLLYDRGRHEEAIACWTESAKRDPEFATPQRNLGFAMFNVRGDGAAALEAYERAFAIDTTDARVLFELDQLAKRLRHDPGERLARLEAHAELCDRRDDLALERITLLNRAGRSQEAARSAALAELQAVGGGEGKVPAQFTQAITTLAAEAIAAEQPEKALALLQRTEPWPDSLGEGKLAGIQENDIHLLMGVALRALGRQADAKAYLERASEGLAEPTSAMFYNDQPPEMIYYQGLALRALGREQDAADRFERLVAYGREHLADTPEIDYFAVSLPEFLVFEPDLAARNERTAGS